MFYIDKNGGIHITRGDSADISVQPENMFEDGTSKPVILTDKACVIFTVKSGYSGETLIKRVLTAKDHSGDKLTFRLNSSETDAASNVYRYSFMYMPDIGNLEEGYTFAMGIFEIMPCVSKTSDSIITIR
ncbi:MAG: hypothetical protein NC320_09130 [Clostridium sp.]|nr:hypothetical protein [Clostridium sp.]